MKEVKQMKKQRYQIQEKGVILYLENYYDRNRMIQLLHCPEHIKEQLREALREGIKVNK